MRHDSTECWWHSQLLLCMNVSSLCDWHDKRCEWCSLTCYWSSLRCDWCSLSCHHCCQWWLEAELMKVWLTYWYPKDMIPTMRLVFKFIIIKKLAVVIFSWLVAPSHYQNQHWLIIREVQWHSNFAGANELTTFSFKSPRGQWVEVIV